MAAEVVNYNYVTPNTAQVRLVDLACNEAYKKEVWGVFESCIQANKKAHENRVKRWNEVCSGVIDIWTRNSAVYKYMRRQELPKPPNLGKLWDKLMKQANTAAEKAQEQEQRREYLTRRKQAVYDLVKAGFVQGEDFYTGNAISMRRQLMIENSEGVWERRPNIPE